MSFTELQAKAVAFGHGLDPAALHEGDDSDGGESDTVDSIRLGQLVESVCGQDSALMRELTAVLRAHLYSGRVAAAPNSERQDAARLAQFFLLNYLHT